jgi:hypothetical protein
LPTPELPVTQTNGIGKASHGNADRASRPAYGLPNTSVYPDTKRLLSITGSSPKGMGPNG